MDRPSSFITPRFWFFSILGATLATLALCIPQGTARADSERTLRTDSGWFVDMNRFAASAHAGFRCEDCHGTMQEEGRAHPNPDDPRFLKKEAIRIYDYSRCQKCHKASYERYMDGGHARARAAATSTAAPAEAAAVQPPPVFPAPSCGACHSSHYVSSGKSRVESGRGMVATCGQCHPAHTASYLANIHGRQAVDLQNQSSAYCTDCHGAHAVASLKDPADALSACRRCHPKAQAEFANTVIHAAEQHLGASESPKTPAIRWIERVRLAAAGVVALSLVFFLGHSFLWILRELHEKLRKH